MATAFPALATCLALLVCAATGVNVSRMRICFNVRAPSVSGPPEFECAFRVHQNTLEQLVLFIPALWMFTLLVSPLWGGLIGLVWVAARVFYVYSYLRDPDSRAPGFAVAFACSIVLLLGALVGAVINLA